MPEAGVHGGVRDNLPEVPARALPAMRVLVVDDDEFNIAFVRSALPSPPLTVATAINGRAALDAARESPPEAVFMDIEMPVMNGFEALAQMRVLEKQAGRKPAVVIAFSSYDDETMRRRCKEAGFDAYLSKPAPRDRIHEILYAVAAGQALPESGGVADGSIGGSPAPGPDDPVIVDADVEAALPRFLQSRGAVLAELRAALAAGEREQARKLAHKLAGSFALYRFDWAAAASRALQHDAATGDPAELDRRCGALQSHLEGVKLRKRGAGADNSGESHGRAQETAAG
jgi:CheY-like chemotaxis protein